LEHLSDQFTTLYHGTSAKHVGKIRKHGLTPPEGVIQPASWYMLTTSREQAARYSKGSVLEYRIPHEAMDFRHEKGVLWPGQEHNVYGHEATAYAVKGKVPSEYLHAVHEHEHKT
jgi:hypothetical protein